MQLQSMSLTYLYYVVGDRLWVTRIPGERDASCSSLCHHRNARGLRQCYKSKRIKSEKDMPRLSPIWQQSHTKSELLLLIPVK